VTDPGPAAGGPSAGPGRSRGPARDAGRRAPLGLRIIAGVKIGKGVVLAGISLGLFNSIHRDLEALAQHFVQVARISPENHYVVLLLGKLGLVDPATLVRIGIMTATYASILLVEGLGLWFGAAWSEYMVVLSTGAFVPEECIAVASHFTALRLSVLLLNVAILAYMVVIVWGRFEARRRRAGATRAK
jgi:uncharacterized membrane protein (DUF2068 family)